MPNIEFSDKFIAFIDVLGFKKLVEAAEAGNDQVLNEVLDVLTDFGSAEYRKRFEVTGPKICPQSSCLQRSLDFRATHISDCLVVSSEVSPAGVINLVHHCWAVVLYFLQKGVMCRGHITRGQIFHTDTQFVGTGYQKAYENEAKVAAFKREADERGTPFVEVDREVCEYVATNGDWCVKEMFSRFAKGDGEVVALFPFQRLSHSFIIGDYGGHKFDPAEEKRANNNVRSWLLEMKERVLALVDKSNPSAVRKAEHYIKALDAQLAVCNSTDEFLVRLTSRFPFPHR